MASITSFFLWIPRTAEFILLLWAARLFWCNTCILSCRDSADGGKTGNYQCDRNNGKGELLVWHITYSQQSEICLVYGVLSGRGCNFSLYSQTGHESTPETHNKCSSMHWIKIKTLTWYEEIKPGWSRWSSRVHLSCLKPCKGHIFPRLAPLLWA